MADIIDLSSQLITGSGADVPLYQVPNSSMVVLQDVINATWGLGNEKATALAGKITAAQTTFLAATAIPDVSATAVTGSTISEPAVTIPTSITASAIYTDFEAQYLELVALLSDKFASFQTTYFPDDTALYTSTETWLTNALNNPDSGLPLTVQNQIWAEDQARILADSARASDAVLATFAARRFPLPPGAAASAVLQIQQKAQDELAESSRKIAIMSVEQLRFVIEKVINTRTVAMSSAIDYIKALASGPDMASRLVGTGYDAQSKLISSASQFYNSRIAAAEAVNKVNQFNSSSALDAATKNQATDLAMVDNKLKALMMEIQSLSQMATSLFNNLHSSVSLSANGGTSLASSPA